MTTAAVVLAAGKGTRFKSELAKVLHRAAGRTLLRWVLEAVRPLGCERVVVITGHQADAVAAEAAAAAVPGLVTVLQAEQRGTGHAVRTAFEAGALDGVDRVLVVPGDAPAISAALLEAVLRATSNGRAATLVIAKALDPTGYGRVLRDERGGVARIVEERDATPEERRISEVNASIYAFAAAPLRAELAALGNANSQGEEYLTDVIAPLVPAGVGAVIAEPAEIAGCNDRAELARLTTQLRARVLDRLMRDGVTIVDPATTYVDADAVVEPDATLLPGTLLEGATRIASGAVIGPYSRLVDSTVEAGATVAQTVAIGAWIGPGATVGPFSYLRPGARLESRSKAGAFVEIKASTVGEGSKVPHLSYIGDTQIGRDVNVGAGTVTCNYDGFDKHATVIGDGAFIGSDTMLVAPVEVGPGAVTGAGSTITRAVPADALAVERSEQRTIMGWAQRRRARHQQRQG